MLMHVRSSMLVLEHWRPTLPGNKYLVSVLLSATSSSVSHISSVGWNRFLPLSVLTIEFTSNWQLLCWALYNWVKHFRLLFSKYCACNRTGKRTVLGLLRDGWNSLFRYFLNNFSDGFRQVSSCCARYLHLTGNKLL